MSKSLNINLIADINEYGKPAVEMWFDDDMNAEIVITLDQLLSNLAMVYGNQNMFSTPITGLHYVYMFQHARIYKIETTFEDTADVTVGPCFDEFYEFITQLDLPSQVFTQTNTMR